MKKYKSLLHICQAAVQQALWEGQRAPFRQQDLCWVISEDMANELMKELEFELDQATVKDPAYANKENSFCGMPAYAAKTPGTLKLCAVLNDLSVNRLLEV